MRHKRFGQQILDQMLLYHAESNHADGIVAKHRIRQTPHDLCHYGFRFRTVLLGLPHIIHTLQLHQFHLGDQIVG